MKSIWKDLLFKRHLWLIFLLCGVIIFQLKQMNDVQTNDYQAIHTLFEHEIRLDAESELNMMMLLNHHIYHYDELTKSLLNMQQSWKEIDSRLSNIPELRPSLEALSASMKLQTQSIESFKTHLGVFFNSERYLFTLTEQLLAKHPEHALELEQLLALSYQYLLESDHQELRTKIDTMLQQMPNFPTLKHHVSILFAYSQDIREDIQTATNCGTPENIHILSQEFDAQHQVDMKLQRESAYILMGLILLL